MEHDLVYKYLVADGDSSVYNKIYEYNPYEFITVEKIEYSNHLFRNFFQTKLANVGKGKPKKWRTLIEERAVRFRKTMERARDFWAKKDIVESEKISNLHRDLLNIPYHVFGDHTKCSVSYCNGNEKTLFLICGDLDF